MSSNNPRVLKLADQIRTIAASMIERRIKDPRLADLVTVTEVRLTGDSREATIFYTVYGTDEERAGTDAALKSAAGMIRTQVGRQLGLKFAPSISFVLDAVPENAAAIEDALKAAHESDQAVAEQARSARYAGESDPYKAKPTADSDDPDAEAE